MKELKPCPFCGVNGLPHPLDHKEGCYLRYFFEILAKGAPTGGDVMREAWNTRAERTCRDFGGEEGTNGEYYDFACDACGWCGDMPPGPNYCPNCGAKVIEGVVE